jgi:hypothetical protein
LDLVHEGEVTLDNISLITFLAHPMPSRVAVSELPGVYVRPA